MYIPVLIAGAGPAGLTSSIVLSRLGARTLGLSADERRSRLAAQRATLGRRSAWGA